MSDSIDDMGYLLGGRIGKEIFAVVYWLCMFSDRFAF